MQMDIPAFTGEDPEPAEPGTKGDLNGDGRVTNADVSALLDAVTSGKSLSLETADLNGDGRVTNADVSALLDLVTGGG